MQKKNNKIVIPFFFFQHNQNYSSVARSSSTRTYIMMIGEHEPRQGVATAHDVVGDVALDCEVVMQ